MTPNAFVEVAPLYTQVEIKNFSPPASITSICEGCKRDHMDSRR